MRIISNYISPVDLYDAIRGKGSLETINKLLDRVADINVEINDSYGTALNMAAFEGNEKIMSLLLDRGADINAVGGTYGTALSAAAYRGREMIVSLLLDQGADVHIVGGDYGTALAAAAYNSTNIVSMLLDRGAQWVADMGLRVG